MTNPIITILNSTDIELDIFDVYNKTGEVTGTYTYTHLGKIAPGQKSDIETIHPASQLQAMCSGTIIGLSDNEQENFPVAVIAASIFSDTTSFTIDNSNLGAMIQSFNFIRYVSANPASKLAKKFITALGRTDQTKAVNQFFADSASFNNCTVSTWSAITGWQTQSLSPWQGSYYLYDTSDDVKEIKLIAGVNITVSGGVTKAVLCTADANGKWSDSSQQVNIVMDGGSITEVNPGQGDISVNLSALWMNATQKQGDTLKYLIAPTLSGTVNNTKVMGNFQQLTTAGAPGGNDGENNKACDPQILNKIQELVSLLISAGMLYIMYKQWREGKVSKLNDVVNKSTDPIKDKVEIENEQANVERKVDTDMHDAIAPHAESVASSVSALPAQELNIRSSETTLALKETLQVQKDRLSGILEEAPPGDEIEAIANDLESAQNELDAGNPDDALDKLSDISSKLNEVMQENNANFSQEQIDASREIQKDIEAANDRNEEIKQAEDNLNEENEQDSDTDFGNDTFESVNSDPIEFSAVE